MIGTNFDSDLMGGLPNTCASITGVGADKWRKVHGSPLSQVRYLPRRGGVAVSAQFGRVNQWKNPDAQM